MYINARRHSGAPQLIFRQLFDLASSTYTYIVASDHGREAIIIDPVKEHTGQYLQVLSQLSLKLVIAIDTHIHADHITALGALRDASGCTTVMGMQTKAKCVSRRVADG